MQGEDAGIKSGKNGHIKRKRKIVRACKIGALFMRAKTEKFWHLFCTKRNKRGMHYAEVRVYTCLFCLSFARNGQMFFVKILRNFFEKIQKNSCQIGKSRVYLFVL